MYVRCACNGQHDCNTRSRQAHVNPDLENDSTANLCNEKVTAGRMQLSKDATSLHIHPQTHVVTAEIPVLKTGQKIRPRWGDNVSFKRICRPDMSHTVNANLCVPNIPRETRTPVGVETRLEDSSGSGVPEQILKQNS